MQSVVNASRLAKDGSNVIEKLDNNEQILLMYLAGELPSADQADVDRLLAVDPGLRQSLAELQACQTLVDEALGNLDEASPLPVSAEAAARQTARAMRQRMAEPKVAATSRADERSPRSWWWLYPTVAAASILVVAMLWLNRQVGPTRLPAEQMPGMHSDKGGDVIATNKTQTPSATPAAAPWQTPAVTVAQNSRDADDALLLASLNSPVAEDEQRPSSDDESKRLALNDAMPQDELSQILLNAKGVQD
ncbi:MAG TPA: hypothetical protein VGI81_17715 [Tepidisphaeraceae bacterium]|jgi:hypothetical protein